MGLWNRESLHQGRSGRRKIAGLSIESFTLAHFARIKGQSFSIINKDMRVTVVSKDALSRDGLTSILLREGLFAFAGASDSIDKATELLGPSGGIMVATDDLGKADWSAVSKAKSSLGVKVVLVAESDKSPGIKVADKVIARSAGVAPLVELIKSFDLGSSRAVAEALQLRYGGKRLSKRELEVAQFVAKGFGNRRISEVLQLREQSVKNLVSCIMTKLGCDNRTQVALALLGNDKAA